MNLTFFLARLTGPLALTLALLWGLLAQLPAAHAGDTSPAQQLVLWSAQAAAPGQAEAGRLFFGSRHGSEWSCASCHGLPPTGAGKHASTGKALDALAPGWNPRSFTDRAKSDKWFRRNCKDVLQRECSASEKANVLAYLISLKGPASP